VTPTLTIGRLAVRGHLGAVEVVGDLDQDARAVAHQLVSTHCAAVVQVLQDLETLLNDAVRLLALDVGHKAHTAGVVFVGGAVQAMLGEGVLFGEAGGVRRHDALLQGLKQTGREATAVQHSTARRTKGV
jgi:hypothetical protein